MLKDESGSDAGSEIALIPMRVVPTASRSELALGDEHRPAWDGGDRRSPAAGVGTGVDLSTFFT
jgi:hypothetical protein